MSRGCRKSRRPSIAHRADAAGARIGSGARRVLCALPSRPVGNRACVTVVRLDLRARAGERSRGKATPRGDVQPSEPASIGAPADGPRSRPRERNVRARPPLPRRPRCQRPLRRGAHGPAPVGSLDARRPARAGPPHARRGAPRGRVARATPRRRTGRIWPGTPTMACRSAASSRACAHRAGKRRQPPHTSASSAPGREPTCSCPGHACECPVSSGRERRGKERITGMRVGSSATLIGCCAQSLDSQRSCVSSLSLSACAPRRSSVARAPSSRRILTCRGTTPADPGVHRGNSAA